MGCLPSSTDVLDEVGRFPRGDGAGESSDDESLSLSSWEAFGSEGSLFSSGVSGWLKDLDGGDCRWSTDDQAASSTLLASRSSLRSELISN